MKQTHNETQVRAGEALGVVRYVLAASLSLAVVAMSTVYFSFI
jgi:hypothetical protein